MQNRDVILLSKKANAAWTKNVLRGLLLAALLLFDVAGAVKIYTPESLPREIQNAIAINAYTNENQTQSDLKGQTQGSVEIRIEIEGRNQFVLYADKMAFALPAEFAEIWKISETRLPKTTNFLDPITKRIKEGYSGQNVFDLRLELKQPLSKALPLDYEFQILSSFQACNREICLLPATVSLPVPLRKYAVLDKADPGLLDKLTGNLKKALDDDALGFGVLQILFLAGLLTAFTPCVYPLYPITMGIFINWSKTSRRTWPLSLLYCIGSILSYAILGLLASASGKVFGSFAQTPAFQLVVGLVLLFSAAFYAGIWEFPIPEKIRAYFSKSGANENSSPKTKLFEALLMGFGLGFVASPCVGPVLVALLAWMSTHLAQDSFGWIEGLALFSVFGAGLMTPFMLLSLLVMRGSKAPRLGAWSEKIKWAGSLLMVAGSLFFLVPAIQGLFPKNQRITFKFPITSSLEEVANSARPKILDFRADWCVACLELEGETFQDSKVADQIKNGWDFVKVDLTKVEGEAEKTAEKFQVLGLPSIVFLNAKGESCPELTLNGFENAERFLVRLARARESCQ